MKKKLGTLIAALAIAGCGGGGGGELNAPPPSGLQEETREVTATVESSFIKGALVCVKGTDNCSETNEKGVARIRVSSLPVELEVRVGGLRVGDLRSSSDTVRINPIVLAEGNLKVAEAIANILHALGGDPEGRKLVLDLSGVKVEGAPQKSLEELLKEERELRIKVKRGNEEHTIRVAKENGGKEGLKVNYDGEACNAANKEKFLIWKVATFLTAANGKVVSLLSSQSGQKVDCSLSVNPENPDQFKLSNCSNPEYNDEGWEEVKLEDGKVVFEGLGGKTYKVSQANLITFTLNLSGDGETVTLWLSDLPTLVPKLSQEEIYRKLERGKFDVVYSYLSSKEKLTDSERVSLAVAVLGKAVKDNLLIPAGLSIISPAGSPFFEVVESGNKVQLKALEEGSKELLTQIERALEELDKVKEPRQVEIPSNLGIEAKTLDEISLKALKALLLYAKSNLEYLLAYSWSVYQDDLEKKYPSILELASKLRLSAESYLENSFEDLKKSAGLLYEAGKEILGSEVTPDTLTYSLIEPTSDGFLIAGKLWADENLETIVENLNAIAASGFNSVNIKLPKDPSDPLTPVNDHLLDLSAPFTSPLTGEQVAQDVNDGNAVEVNLCTSHVEYEDAEGNWHVECIKHERDIWITADSNLYKFLESIYSDVKNKLGEPFQYNGKTYYSLQGFYVDPEYSDYYVVYPRK